MMVPSLEAKRSQDGKKRRRRGRLWQSAFRHRGDAMPRGGAVRSLGDAMGGERPITTADAWKGCEARSKKKGISIK